MRKRRMRINVRSCRRGTRSVDPPPQDGPLRRRCAHDLRRVKAGFSLSRPWEFPTWVRRLNIPRSKSVYFVKERSTEGRREEMLDESHLCEQEDEIRAFPHLHLRSGHGVGGVCAPAAQQRRSEQGSRIRGGLQNPRGERERHHHCRCVARSVPRRVRHVQAERREQGSGRLHADLPADPNHLGGLGFLEVLRRAERARLLADRHQRDGAQPQDGELPDVQVV